MTPAAPSPRPESSTPAPIGQNVFIKISGTREGRLAVEEAIFAGISVNVALLFSSRQYLAAAEAYPAWPGAAARSRLQDPDASDVLYVKQLQAPFTITPCRSRRCSTLPNMVK